MYIYVYIYIYKYLYFNKFLYVHFRHNTIPQECTTPPCTITQMHCPTAGPKGWYDAIVNIYVDDEPAINFTLLELANIGDPTHLVLGTPSLSAHPVLTRPPTLSSVSPITTIVHVWKIMIIITISLSPSFHLCWLLRTNCRRRQHLQRQQSSQTTPSIISDCKETRAIKPVTYVCHHVYRIWLCRNSRSQTTLYTVALLRY